MKAERYDGQIIELPDGVRLVECEICGWCHPQDFDGDCREDAVRFHTPENPDDMADSFDHHLAENPETQFPDEP